MMKQLLFIALLGLIFACNSKPSETTSPTTPTPATTGNENTTATTTPAPATPAPTVAKLPENISAEFSWDIDESGEYPNSTIYLTVNGKKYDIEDSQGFASEVSDDVVPEEAIASCQTYFAGGGDLYLVVKGEGELIVKKGFVDEMVSVDDTRKQEFKDLMKISAKDLE